MLDGGLFHTFDAGEQPRYASSLAAVTEPGGMLYLLCFSDAAPEHVPHPISQQDLRRAFCRDNGSEVVAIVPERVETRFHDGGAPAWLATIKRVAVAPV